MTTFSRMGDFIHKPTDLPDRPMQNTASSVKQYLQQPSDDIKNYVNNSFLPELESTGADKIGITPMDGKTEKNLRNVIADHETRLVKADEVVTSYNAQVINEGNSNAEIVDARGGDKTQPLRVRLDGIDTQLEENPKLGYSNTLFDTWKKRFESVFINAKDFGAKGDGTTNDTVAIQNAINHCISNNLTLYFPVGIYIVTGALQISGNIRIVGDRLYAMFNSTKSVIKHTGTLFSDSTNGTRSMSVENMTFLPTDATDANRILFDIKLTTFLIQNCSASDYYIIFNQYVSGASKILNNVFTSIHGYFWKCQGADTIISYNYINGSDSYNAIAFEASDFSTMTVSHNYIDFMKYVFYGANYCKNNIITNNIFDIIFHAFHVNAQYCLITNNQFTNISPSAITTYFKNADADMTGGTPCGIYDCDSSSFLQYCQVMGNIFYIQTALYFNNGFLMQCKFEGNIYQHPENNMVLIGRVSGTAQTNKNFIDALYRATVTSYPGVNWQNFNNIFPDAEFIYNNKVIRFVANDTNDGTWYDLMGNVVSS